MAFRYQERARRRVTVAGLVGVSLVVVFGPLLAVPAVALAAFVYYAHQLAAVLAGDEGVRNPSLAFVIVVNALVIMMVQFVVFVEGFGGRV